MVKVEDLIEKEGQVGETERERKCPWRRWGFQDLSLKIGDEEEEEEEGAEGCGRTRRVI
jgi:hypothetical protein